MDDERVKRRFPTIPSMPVPLDAAREILRALRGPRVPDEWRGRLGLPEDAGVGPGPAKVNFTYMEEKKLARIQNVFGVIEGAQEPDRYIILGNHRDAWTYGAVDPNSGTATLLEVARRLGILLKMGWRPRRTMILSSWDGEEFGMMGSTEWVEENLGSLASKTVAYLNVDCAVQGPGLFASATPQLDKLLHEVTKRVKDPDSNGISIFQAWEAETQGANIGRLGRADSDFTAFLHHAGIPSVDLYYGKDFPVYHTSFDSYDWMMKYGDPLFHRHVAVAGIWGLLALRLANDPVLPFDYLSYVAQLQEHIQAYNPLIGGSLEPINASIHDFIDCAKDAANEVQKLNQEVLSSDTEQKRRSLNDRLMLAERGFLDAEGLQGRHWFKHMLYAPPEHTVGGIDFFPGIVDAVHNASTAANGGESSVAHEIWRVARAIRRAAHALAGQLP